MSKFLPPPFAEPARIGSFLLTADQSTTSERELERRNTTEDFVHKHQPTCRYGESDATLT